MTEIGGMGPTIVGVTIFQCLLALLFVCIRVWARVRLFSGLRADDYWLISAMVFLTAFTSVSVAAAHRGLGRHGDDLTSVPVIMKLSKLLFTYVCIFPWSVMSSKAAVAAFLLMIVVKKIHKIVIYSSMGILAFLSGLEFIGLFVQCTPVESNWNPFITDKTCKFDVNAVGYALAGYSAFLDFFLAALPWFFLRNIQIKRRERLAINLSLSSGVFAGICGVIRLQQIVVLQSAKDRNYQFSPTILWSSTELTVSIICVCFPATRSIYRRYVKGLTSTNGDSTARSGKRTRHTGNMYTLNDRSRGGPSVNGNGVVVTGGVGNVGRRKANHSDESILGEEFRMQNINEIKQTTSVVVDFDDEDSARKDGVTDKSVEVV